MEPPRPQSLQRRNVGRIGGLPRGRDQAVDVADGEDLRQRPAALGTFEDGRGIVAAMAFGIKEAIELPDRRQPTRHRCRPECAGGEVAEIGPQIGRGGGCDRAPPGLQEGGEIVEVARIGHERVSRAAPLGGEHVEKQLGQAQRRRLARSRRHWRLTKWSGGTVTLISRVFGLT
jgi:hypothetical protein